MADLTPEQIAQMTPAEIQAATEALKAQGQAVQGVTENVTNLNTAQQDSLGVMHKINEWLTTNAANFDKMGELTGASAVQFGLLATEVAGAEKRLQSLSKLDTGNLGSFSDSVQNLIDNVTKVSPAGALASGAVTKLVGSLSSMGVAGNVLNSIIAKGVPELARFAQSFLNSADNALRFQSVLVTSAARAGDSKDLYQGTADTMALIGENFENANQTIANFGSMYSRVMGATKTSSKEGQEAIYKYIDEIGQIPGGLMAMTKGMDIAGTHTDTLTSIMQLAQGTGLDMNGVLADIHTTTENMGTSIADATKFEARMADVSGDLHGQQKDVHQALFDTANAFKLYTYNAEDAAKMTQGVANSVKMYALALEKAGVPAKNALEIAGKQVKAMKDLGEGQEALIAQDSGMGGGIGGALKFEMLQRTDPQAASRMMMQSMMKRMGGASNLVELKDAANGSEQQQQQYELQRQMLLKGTLGIKANDKAEADTMIEQMIKGQNIFDKTDKTDANKVLSTEMEKGAKKEQLATTAVSEANIAAESVRITAQSIDLGFLQNAASGRTGAMGGTDGKGRGLNTQTQDYIRSTQSRDTAKSDEGNFSQMKNRVSSLMANSGMLGSSLVQSMRDQVTERDLLPSIQQNINVDKYGKPIQNTSSQGMPQSHNFGAGLSPYTPAYKQVGLAAAASKGAHPLAQGTGGTSGPMHANQPTPVTLVGGSGITVNFTGKCPHCGWDVHTSEQARIQSAPSQASNKG